MRRRVIQTAMLGLSLTPFVLGISTVNAVKGLSTAPALNMNMRDQAHAWADYVAGQSVSATNPASVAQAIAPLTQSICQAAEDELKNGLLSGSRGPGAVSASFRSVCVSLRTISDSLSSASTDDGSRGAEISALSERLKMIPEQDSWGIFERRAQFEQTTASIKTLLAEETSQNLTETVRTQLDLALNAVVTLERKGGSFGERQKEAVDSLRTQLENAGQVLNRFLDGQNNAGGIEEPVPLMSSGSAIARYWPRLTPQILAAVGVDLAILWVAAFLAVSRGETADAISRIIRKRRDDVRSSGSETETGATNHAG